ncbi:hypothetical protein B0T21DRAFT_177553 [Apiosordaria backusii]|uniref:Uncharacterized protein n=1 Tax=Apiosordaria backusii TaxID=314023 RepID=A0AA40BL50_9PEZI|nr:hypothetical protein B0T21DRAFT_177553 [Apiosordaria backusii]
MRAPLAFVVGSCLGHEKWIWFKKRPGKLAGFVRFDDASRGPLGSMSLLWWLKLKHWATLGAITTLALVAVDPFFQALVEYEGELVVVNATADSLNGPLISRASGLNIGERGVVRAVENEDFTNLGLHTDTLQYLSLFPDTGMSSTMLMSLINSSLSYQVQPPSLTCSTGNCTWPAFSSLALCSSCFDITSRIVKEEKIGTTDENTQSPFGPGMGNGLAQGYITNYVVPYKGNRRLLAQAFNGFVDVSVPSVGESQQPWARVGLMPVFDPRDTFNFRDSGTLLASFAMVTPPRAYWDGNERWENTTMKATECALQFCARVHKPQMRNGPLNDTILLDSSAFERVPESWNMLKNLSVSCIRQHGLQTPNLAAGPQTATSSSASTHSPCWVSSPTFPSVGLC